MVCLGDRCGCGAFCRRLFCRARPPDNSDNEDNPPVTLTQLAEARDVNFTLPFLEPLSVGSHIICSGTPSDDLPWFAVNIGCGTLESDHADIAVHFNVRFPQCYVVRNTRRHNKWGLQETTAFRLFPFKMGCPFKIEILIDEKESLWSVDGEFYCSFTHRNPSPLAASWVEMTGIRDAAIRIQSAYNYPDSAPILQEVPLRASVDTPANDGEPKWRPNASGTLKKGIPEGHQIVIKGRLRPMLHSFAVELTDYAREWPRPNVLMHANLRAHVDAQCDRQLVVLNAWLGEWGPERRQRTARLVPGTNMTFRVVRGPGEWSVFADDMLIGELEYRASPAGVRAVRVRGDLFPEEIYIAPTTSSPIREDSIHHTAND